MRNLIGFFEERAYGVCSKVSEKLQVPTYTVRLFFIYASFLTFGSPLIIYLALAFWIDVRKVLRRRRTLQVSRRMSS